MDIQRHIRLFDWIAPVYSWFFTYQVGKFQQTIAENPDAIPQEPGRILDIGCGTGALAFVLSEQGHEVTGLDASQRMVAIARRLNRGNKAVFIHGNALDWPGQQPGGLAIDRVGNRTTSHNTARTASRNASHSAGRTASWNASHDAGVSAGWAQSVGPFDIVIASYVLHGLPQHQRHQLYQVMKQLARQRIIIMDYNERRDPLISLLEWFERGDYFQFIYAVMTELREVFPQVKVIQTGPYAAWYICDCQNDEAPIADDSD